MERFQEYIDYESLEQIFAVANTPTYLYNGFLKNQTILVLSTSFSEEKLITFFFNAYNEKRTFRNLVTLYALVIAISLKGSSYTDSFFQNLPEKEDIKWSKELAIIYFSRMKVTNFIEYESIPYNPVVPNNSVSHSNSVEFNIS